MRQMQMQKKEQINLALPGVCGLLWGEEEWFERAVESFAFSFAEHRQVDCTVAKV